MSWWLLNDSVINRSIINYILFGREVPTLCTQVDHCITTSEISHLKDVHIRFQWLYLILPSLFVVKPLMKVKIGQKAIAIITISLLIISANFQKYFIIMHYLLFPSGNWAFPASSVLIQTYPPTFWGYAAGAVTIFSFLFLILYLTKPHISGSMKRIRYVVTTRRSWICSASATV